MNNIIPVVITPFTNSGELYVDGVNNLYSYLSSYNVKTLFVSGSYAAFALMHREMRIELAHISTNIAKEYDMESIFNIGSSSVDETEILIEELDKLDISSYATIAPYYYSNAGLYGLEDIKRYLTYLVAGTSTPLYFYNNGKTTGMDLTALELDYLANETGIAGIKDSSDNIKKLFEISDLSIGQENSSVEYIPGTTASILIAGSLNIKKCMSGIFLCFPELVSKLSNAANEGRFQEALHLYKQCMKARDIMGKYGPRPVSAYYVLRNKGVDVGEPKFPWPRLDKVTQSTLFSDLKHHNLL
jgi:dihydrodipicolinate synthase/N-acetylneuraminate lyase